MHGRVHCLVYLYGVCIRLYMFCLFVDVVYTKSLGLSSSWHPRYVGLTAIPPRISFYFNYWAYFNILTILCPGHQHKHLIIFLLLNLSWVSRRGDSLLSCVVTYIYMYVGIVFMYACTHMVFILQNNVFRTISFVRIMDFWWRNHVWILMRWALTKVSFIGKVKIRYNIKKT